MDVICPNFLGKNKVTEPAMNEKERVERVKKRQGNWTNFNAGSACQIGVERE